MRVSLSAVISPDSMSRSRGKTYAMICCPDEWPLFFGGDATAGREMARMVDRMTNHWKTRLRRRGILVNSPPSGSIEDTIMARILRSRNFTSPDFRTSVHDRYRCRGKGSFDSICGLDCNSQFVRNGGSGFSPRQKVETVVV